MLYIFAVLSDEYRRQRKRERRRAYKQWMRARGYTGVHGRELKNAAEDAWMDYVRANHDSPVGVEVAYTITHDFWTLPIPKVDKTTPNRKVRSNGVVKQRKQKVSSSVKKKRPILQFRSSMSILQDAWKKLALAHRKNTAN